MSAATSSGMTRRWSPLIPAVLASGVVGTAAFADPIDGVVRAGSATIQSAPGSTTVTQTSARAVIDWRSFSIGPTERVQFVQPNAQAALLNRVTGSQFSSLQGTLTANGQVYLVNPNGIVIGNGARIDAASFVASTANIGNDSFMADPASVQGRYAFEQLTTAANTATISNAGTITVADGGLVALVAPSVRNSGTITARLGKITLGSARYFTLDLFGDDLIRLAAPDSLSATVLDTTGAASRTQLDVAGQLLADGGRIVLLSVPAASAVMDQAINLTGVVRAQTASNGQRGSIRLLASGNIRMSGSLNVNGVAAADRAGDLALVGRSITLASTAQLWANGGGGGGSINVGGRWPLGSTPLNTEQVQIDAGAQVRACGTAACAADASGGSGQGGVVSVVSTQGTSVAGELNVSAGTGRQAGIIEVLSDAGPVSLAATGKLIARTASGQLAGFIAVVGQTLSLAPAVSIDLRNSLDQLAEGQQRLISDTTPGSAVRSYVVEDGLVQRRTEAPLLFHAYANNGYENSLPGPNVFTFLTETPVGTVRPNGGAPTNLAGSASDPLTAIAVTLTPPPTPTPTPGSESTSVAESTRPTTADQTDNGPRATLLAGGPGVGRTADLGRSGSVAGASPDVFTDNQHVIAPATNGDANDGRVSDYLCTTPYSENGCASNDARGR